MTLLKKYFILARVIYHVESFGETPNRERNFYRQKKKGFKKPFQNKKIKSKIKMELVKMLFKEFIGNLTNEVKEYRDRREILNNSSMDFEDIATDEELEIYNGEDTSIFDFFDYYYLSRIREYIGKVIEKLVEDDSRFNDVIVWYFDIDGQPELEKELLKKIFNADENIFTDEVQKVIFKILLWSAERERENGKNYTDVYRFEEDIMPELYFLAVKDNVELLEDFKKDEANFVNYRMKNKMDWEKFL